MAAAAPCDVKPAGQRSLHIRNAQTLQNDRVDHGDGQLARGFRRHDDTTGETVVKQIFKRAGLILMRMADEQVLCSADVLRPDVRQLVSCIAALIAAVYNKRRFFAFHDITMPLLAAGFSGQIELHERPPCG